MIRKTILLATLGAFAFTLSGCNAVKGLGQDIQSVGNAGEDAID